jgi:hypothetical protein
MISKPKRRNNGSSSTSSSQLTPRRSVFLDTCSKTPELKSSQNITNNPSPRTLNLRKLYHIKNVNYQTSEQLYNNRKPDQKWMEFKRDDGNIQMFIPMTPDGEIPLKRVNKQSPVYTKNPKRLRIFDSDSDNSTVSICSQKIICKTTSKLNELEKQNSESINYSFSSQKLVCKNTSKLNELEKQNSESIANSCISPVILPMSNSTVSRY